MAQDLPNNTTEHELDRSELLDLLGRRWMPRILVELHSGAIGFSELRRRCDNMSSSVLSDRLDDLRQADLASPDDFAAWELSELGAQVARPLADLPGTARRRP